MVGIEQTESARCPSDSTDDNTKTKSSAMTSLEPSQCANEQVPPAASRASTDVEGNVEIEIEIETEDASISEADVPPREASRSPGYGRDAASLYAPSRFPKRLDMGAKPKFTVIGDSIMEEESIDLAASTRSLVERYLDYNEENGRRYCGTYYMPNDEIEQTRLYLSHQVFLYMLDGEPSTVPLVDPKLVLDIGTGTGDWAIQVGEKYPGCEVIGTDISAIQSTCPPYNVFFEIEDAELPWLRQPDSIDLVHMRHLGGAFRDWRFIYEQAYECLRPGGWLEMQEYNDEDNWDSFLAYFPPDASVHKLVRDFYLSGIKSGRPRGIAHLDTKYLLEAGFVDAKVTDYSIPISASTGSAGRIWLMTVVDAFEASCLRPLTTYMGWDPEHTKKCCEETAHLIARYAKDPQRAESMTIKVRIVTARKPDAGVGGWNGDDDDDAYLQSGMYMQTDQVSAEQISILTSDTTKTSVPGQRTPVESVIDYHDETSTQAALSRNGAENGVEDEINGKTNRDEASARRTTITAVDMMDLDDQTKPTQ